MMPLLSEEAWREIRLRKLRELLRWRYWAHVIHQAVLEVLGPVNVYVFGSVVEGRHTVDSDLDIAIVLPEAPKSAGEDMRIVCEVLDRAEEKGLPWWFPADVHIIDEEEFEMLKRGGARFLRIS